MQNGEKISVELGERRYDIVLAQGALLRAGELIGGVNPKSRVFVVTDTNVQALHLKTLLQSLEKEKISAKVFAIAPGEASKSFSTLETLVSDLIASGIERNDALVAFGGGVVGDLAGFAAAITLRGINLIQIPTTLLAQVDSSIGGKTAIDLPQGKNLVGAFYQPRLVIIDPELLVTLDEREKCAGYAEIVKMALISDADFFAWLEENITAVLNVAPQCLHAIGAACRMKAQIVARDERESSERMLLNLGHSFGHALEALTGYSNELLHGEAVAIGIAMAFRFSAFCKLCAPENSLRVQQHLESAKLPVSAKKLKTVTAQILLSAMQKDKKMKGGAMQLILAHGIGKAFVASDIDRSNLMNFLQQDLK
jgi:3-dehydroquinate synthase